MAITSVQTRLLHIAAKAIGWNDAQYRMALRNAGGVESSKQLDQAGFENVLALLEDSGFADDRHAPDYWRSRVAGRGSVCGPRMLRKIEQLASRQRYALPALCLRFSGNRTNDVQQLTPREAWELIEMLKAAIEREGGKADQTANSAADLGMVEPASTPV